MLDTQRIAADLLAVAAEAHGEGDPIAASTYARAALQADPSSAAACNLIGLAEFDRGAHAEAAVYLKRAAILDPESCFAGSLLEIALACDRRYMLDDAKRPVSVRASQLSDGLLPTWNGESRLAGLEAIT